VITAFVKCIWVNGKGAFVEGTGIGGVLSRMPQESIEVTKDL
jgi:hypothetical protein